MSAIVQITFSDGRREDRPLGPGVYRIGRDVGDLILNDPNTSAVHAELRVTGPGLVELVDLGSTNGSFDPNGNRISGAFTLRPEQAVRLGSTTLMLRRAEPARGATAVMPQFTAPPAAPYPAPAAPYPASPPAPAAAYPASPPVAAAAPSLTPPPAVGNLTGARRATIIKVPDNTPGLLFVEGRQLPFWLPGIWRSATAPAANQVVDVELDAAGNVSGVTAIDAQQLTLERLNDLGNSAQEQAKLAVGAVKKHQGLLFVAAAAVSLLVAAGVGASLLLGFGDGLSKRSLGSKLDEKLAEKPVCWALRDMDVTFPVTVSSDFSGGPTKDPIIVGLIRGSYVTAVQVARFPGSRPGPFDPTVLDLTEKGRAEKVWDSSRGFCVGKREVDEVVRWTEPASSNGVLATRIDYTWKLGDRPSWATPELFSEVKGMEKPVEDLAIAQKTSDGWHIVMH